MQNVAERTRENTTLDVFKMLACILITITHLPSIFPDEIQSVYFNQWFFRVCVPFFFVSSGYFFHKAKDKTRMLKRIGWLFILGYLLYLPVMLEGTGDLPSIISKLRWDLVVGYEHLWYLSAVAEGLLIWYVAEKIPVVSAIFRKIKIPACVILFLLGALLDEHYRILDNVLIRKLGEALEVFGGPRNVVFIGFPMLIFGGAIAQYEERIRRIPTWLLLVLWVALRWMAFEECRYLLNNLGNTIDNDLSFFGCWPALILFAVSLRIHLPIPESFAKLLRKMAEYIYILHPMVAAYISRNIYLEPVPLWAATVGMCAGIYILLEKQFVFKK